MFQRVLIANRGEIAVRIIRCCREMGISPIAVFSDADRLALHVRLSDQAIHIGPSPSRDSYLSVDKIIDAAKRTGAEAIHPGYGFLSENADFAQTVERAGLVLIGPPASAMRIMGEKTSARRTAQQAGAPVVPGATAALTSIEEGERIAATVGFPIMLKAAAGGGGKGMRLVRSKRELASAYELAASEAEASFNDRSLYVEKYIDRPRHIEIQLLADGYGNVVHLGERECSVQRRHQKVVEECPSPVVDPEMRQRMGEAAVAIARAAGYVNAGTIEFLVDQEKNFYFLEMNTRLQVEHPVTELVTGRDIVREQIRIAAGDRLSFSQSDVVMRGAAIECRVYAEDPANNFVPSPGRITRLRVPQGPGVRDDSGIYEGWEVPVHYDSLLAKLSVWAEDRAAAIQRMSRALGEYNISGIQTSLGFFAELVRDEQFRRGETDTGFIERFFERKSLEADSGSSRTDELAAIAAVLHARSNSSRPATELERVESRWKLYGRLSQRRGELA